MVSTSQLMWLWTNSCENGAWAAHERGIVAIQNDGGGNSIHRAAIGVMGNCLVLSVSSRFYSYLHGILWRKHKIQQEEEKWLALNRCYFHVYMDCSGNRNRPVRSKQRLAAGVSKEGDCPWRPLPRQASLLFFTVKSDPAWNPYWWKLGFRSLIPTRERRLPESQYSRACKSVISFHPTLCDLCFWGF